MLLWLRKGPKKTRTGADGGDDDTGRHRHMYMSVRYVYAYIHTYVDDQIFPYTTASGT